MTVRPATSLYGIALHEAGHTVIARALGMAVAGVEVSRKRGGYGNTRSTFPDPPADETPDAALQRSARAMAVHLAGDVAGGRVQAAVGGYRGDHVDRQRALDIAIHRVGEADAARFVEEADAWTRTLVATHRSAIEAVARELVKRRRLSGADVDRIMAERPG